MGTYMKVALIAFAIAFIPITLASHGLILPGPFVAWCFIIGYPIGLIALIGGMGECDER